VSELSSTKAQKIIHESLEYAQIRIKKAAVYDRRATELFRGFLRD
jgi:hypothetical protein